MPTPPFSSQVRHRPRVGRRGFALVVVLIVISVLALVVVGYLSSMSQERATANAFANKTRAEQSAQAGVDTAMGILRDYFKAFPDSATVWDTAQSQNAADPTHPNEGTTLYFRAVPTNATSSSTDTPNLTPGNASDSTYNDANYVHGNNPGNADGANGADGRKIFVLPLVSGATVARVENKANAVRGADDPAAAGGSVQALTTANSVNLNARRSAADSIGWLGTPPTYVNPQNAGGNLLPKPFNVPWVEIKQQDGSASPPVIGRYAFWVEDESFRANINTADAMTNSAGNPQPNDARRDNDANKPLNATDVSLLGLFASLDGTDPATARANLLGARAAYPGNTFPETSAYTHAAGTTSSTNNGLRYLTTTQSAGLNLSRHGTQRLSLNAVVDPSVVPNDAGALQKQLDKIVRAIQFHAPNFGQRFYRNTANVTPTELNGNYVESSTAKPYTQIYLAKIAANIRDYIDPDSVPTCVFPADASHPCGMVQNMANVKLPVGDLGPTWAVGKDAAFYISECAVRFTGGVSGTGASSSYTLNTNYYIEVWNMGTRDIRPGDLGANAYIRIASPPRWVGCTKTNQTLEKPLPCNGPVSPSDVPAAATVPPSPSPRDFEISISQVTFPAGVCTVITTDPQSEWSTIITDAEAAKHVVTCSFKSPGTPSYTGSMPKSSADGVTPVTYCDEIIMVPRNGGSNAGTGGVSDYETDIVIGSDSGHIDSLGGAMPTAALGKVAFTSSITSTTPKIYGGCMRGNWTNTASATNEGKQASIVGDPRTNNEPLAYDPSSTSAGSSERTRFNNYPNNNTQGVYQTLGLPNYQSVRPNRPENPWPDYPPLFAANPANTPTGNDLKMDASRAPAFIANEALTSIGQLGDVFDPARIIYPYPTVAAGILTSHGGGRTLKIGQHDDRWDGDEFSLSRGWTSWRLADFFCVADSVRQPGLVDFNGISQTGLFNLNGVTRDNGAALRAALYGFRFQPTTASGDPTLADSSSSPSRLKIDALVSQLVSRLTASPVNADGTGNTGTTQTGAGPLWERGELSELPLFGRTLDTTVANSATTYATTALTSLDMSSKIFDRGREELVRRLIEMTTTRGSVYTVYALGQALQPDPNNAGTRRVVGTHQLKVTFRLVPKKSVDPNTGQSPDFHPGVDSKGNSTDGTTSENGTSYDANNGTQLSARFAKPDHYDIQVISTSSGSN